MVSVESLMNKAVAIFGTGYHAARCLYLLQGRNVNVNFFYNNNPSITSFLGKEVFVPNEQNVKAVYVVVASLETTYAEIAIQLKGFGIKEFEDFIYYDWLEKEIVLLHGNCHILVLKEYLKSSTDFCDKYAIYPNPLIYENRTGKIEESVLRNCDVWVHEDIREDNPFGYDLSDKGIRESIKPNVLEIIIPHLFGFGKMFFPQAVDRTEKSVAMKSGDISGEMFPYEDKVIKEGIEKRLSTEKIISLCKSSQAISKDEILCIFQMNMQKIRQREQCWDIKIYDFLVDNYKKCKLFYDPIHPTNVVLEEISRKVLEKLRIQTGNIVSNYCLDYDEIPVYPCVTETLKLGWNEEEIRKSIRGKKFASKLDFEEYVREYIWWCYENKT